MTFWKKKVEKKFFSKIAYSTNIRVDPNSTLWHLKEPFRHILCLIMSLRKFSIFLIFCLKIAFFRFYDLQKGRNFCKKFRPDVRNFDQKIILDIYPKSYPGLIEIHILFEELCNFEFFLIFGDPCPKTAIFWEILTFWGIFGVLTFYAFIGLIRTFYVKVALRKCCFDMLKWFGIAYYVLWPCKWTKKKLSQIFIFFYFQVNVAKHTVFH